MTFQCTDASSILGRSIQEWCNDAALVAERVDSYFAAPRLERLARKWRHLEIDTGDVSVWRGDLSAVQPHRVDHVGERRLLSRGFTQRSVFQPARIKVRIGNQ